MQVIPIVHCFDNNYVIPAAVAFYSLLEKSDKNYKYQIYVLHEDITLLNQEKLKKTIQKFKNSELIFINFNENVDFENDWKNIKTKGHYSKAMFYKLSISSLIKEHKKMIVSDVDVIYLNDISKDFIEYNNNDDNNYISGVFSVDKILSYNDVYKKSFSNEEISQLKIGAGYFFMNADLIRKDNLEKRFKDYLEKNSHRLIQPEQDVLNFCCHPRVGKLPLRNMVCNYVYSMYDRKEFVDEVNYTKEELLDAYDNPIQLHYASRVKPWNKLDSIKANLWLECILKTEFFEDYFSSLEQLARPNGEKKLFSFTLPLKKNKKFRLDILKIKS
ncbi:glycosyltransferase family 8 protein [Vibrio alginolyticus]|jgi:lipopolysaccharide biosynthesis glycosyltransferase|uniref:Glycosyltransferase family 8 protein n=5 Tax=Vibrio TaxID=662 RepID=A0A7Y4AZC3_VIBAL|nr:MULTISPECIES: glycosyltransferase [Vibrio]MDG2626401.1 glycosyltransferase [Vibrio parahaemolyticus]EGQ7902709.1 hypothetical protein [Vibrio alginolyticus]EGQ9764856.1 hypothetical protein [Vibrio alginolyticus]EGR1561351.1 hypothetical protein [Vibrio alginolyticus]EIE5865692.1 hypothetical protein [Vibrio alginolyticus]